MRGFLEMPVPLVMSISPYNLKTPSEKLRRRGKDSNPKAFQDETRMDRIHRIYAIIQTSLHDGVFVVLLTL